MSLFRDLLLAASIGSFALPARAQEAEHPFAVFRVNHIPRLIESCGRSRLGALLADEDVASMVDRLLTGLREQREMEREILDTAMRLNVELGPGVLNNAIGDPNPSMLLDHPLSEWESLEASIRAPEGDALPPNTMLLASCRPRFEGRWAMTFERDVQRIASCSWFTVDRNAKIHGSPALVATVPDKTEGAYGFPGFWMQHLPGLFAYGTGSVASAERTHREPASDEPMVAVEVDCIRYLETLQTLGGGLPLGMLKTGIGSLLRLTWRATLVDELLLDEMEAVFDGPAQGLLGALIPDGASLPPQPLPKGALLQLRAAIAPGKLIAILEESGAPLSDAGLDVTEEEKENLIAALNGGVALGVAAPTLGGMIPRLYLSLGVSDEDAVRTVLDAFVAGLGDEVAHKEISYGGVSCTMLRISGAPQAIRPTFCLHEGVLHITESERTLRRLLRDLKNGKEAMDVGDATVPLEPAAGEPMAGFDLRYDTAAAYRAFHDVWLPLYVMSVGATGLGKSGIPIGPRDMPPTDIVAEHCAPSRGVLLREGNRYTLRTAGTLGGPVLASLAMTWGPILSDSENDYTTNALILAIAKHRLRTAWEAIETFEGQHGRWPRDLPELFAAAHLDDDALLLPGHGATEEVRLADGRTVRSSFRYFPRPVTVSAAGETYEMLLIEIRPRPWNRAMLDTTGETPQLWGNDCERPIDEFGN